MQRATAVKELNEWLGKTECLSDVASVLARCFPDEFEKVKGRVSGDELIQQIGKRLIARVGALFPLNDWWVDAVLFEDGTFPDTIPVLACALEWWEEGPPDPLCRAILDALQTGVLCPHHEAMAEGLLEEGEEVEAEHLCGFNYGAKVDFRKLRRAAARANLPGLDAAVRVIQHSSGNWWVDITVDELDSGGGPLWDRPTIDCLAQKWKEARTEFFQPYGRLLKRLLKLGAKRKRRLAQVTEVVKQCRIDA